MVLPVDPMHGEWMRAALAEAAAAGAAGEVPVGAVVVEDAGRVIATGRNEREATHDPTAHAEVVALRAAAAARGDWNLEGCALVVTLEPCAMCAGALLAARISTLVFGAWDEKGGAVGSRYDLVRDRRLPFRVEVTAGVDVDAAAALLQRFFTARR